MASVGCLGALGAGARTYKPAKADYFSGFRCDIQLDQDQCVAKPLGVLNGNVVIDTVHTIRCRGIRVQLDATVNLKYDTKTDGRVSSHRKIEGIFQESEEPTNYHYIRSPVRQDVIVPDSQEEGIVLEPGTYTYSFSLAMPAEPLPSPFRSQYGNLSYKIVVYMKSYSYFVEIEEKHLRFRGYNNLSELSNYLEPLKHESGIHKSLFSSKKIITAILTVKKRGFLPGEELPFHLAIINPKSYVVRKINVNLVRRVIYNINGATKTTIANVDSFEDTEISKDDEIYCAGKLTVPRNAMPSFNAKPVYSVFHILQYEVKVAEYPGPIKGQVDVVIGTTKEPVDEMLARRVKAITVDDICPSGRQRSSSISSRLSDSSVMTTISLPPAYSQLSSRAVSMMSLETLPPHYDDLV